MKFALAGFSGGLLLYARLREDSPLRKEAKLMLGLAVLTVALALLNFIPLPSRAAYGLVYGLLFSSAGLFGFAYGSVVSHLGLPNARTLFLLMLGSAIAVAVHNVVLIHLTFLFAYLVFFLTFLGLAYWTERKALSLPVVGAALLVLAGALYANSRPFQGQIYNLPSFLEPFLPEGIKPVRSIPGPYGILDVLCVSPQECFLISDKQSPSVIVAKGDIDSVDPEILHPYALREYEEALIIGPGGGQDLVAALHAEVKRITAVEIDAQRVKLMQGEFSERTGGLFNDSRVEVVVAGARSFLESTPKKFDLITLHRPWTSNLVQSHLLDTSGELLTEEALDAYIGAINDDGVIFWTLPTPHSSTFHIPSYFAAFRAKAEVLRERLLIFKMRNAPIVGALYAPPATLNAFLRKEDSDVEILYHPSMASSQELNAVKDFIFGSPGVASRRVDRQFYGLYLPETLVRNTAGVLVALLLVGILLGRPGTGATAYLYLGVGYELVAFFFVKWIASFTPDPIRALPALFLGFFLLSSLGYLYAQRLERKTVLRICGCLALGFVAVSQVPPLGFGTRIESHGIALPLVLFLVTGFAIALPFGHLVSEEEDFPKAFAIDFWGALIAIPVLFLIGNLDYLLGASAAIYAALGFLFWKFPLKLKA